MTLTNIKKLKDERGFTIVELLIVIVVIAILAAIVIVAYNGIQNRARLSSAQGAASTVMKKAAAYAADGPTGNYPTTYGALTSAASSTTYNIPSGSITQLTSVPAAGSPPASPSSILFYTCDSGGGVRIGYYDYVAGSSVSTGSTITAGSTTSCSLATT